MRRFRRTLLSLLIWLTAGASLVAGTPRLVCACDKCSCACCPSENEEHKCCMNASNREPVAPCCQCARSSTAHPNGGGPQVQGPHCVKSLVKPQWLSMVHHQGSSGAGWAMYDPPGLWQVTISLNRPTDHGEWHERPPPTNLVVAHLRLVI
jgi:hypothetical protein